jgi:hypothetical protein
MQTNNNNLQNIFLNLDYFHNSILWSLQKEIKNIHTQKLKISLLDLQNAAHKHGKTAHKNETLYNKAQQIIIKQELKTRNK